jgi:hypothetical protein
VSKKLGVILTSTLCFFVLLSYQNCGTEPQGSLFAKKTYSNLPYETTIDQIAYMSCAEQNGVPNDIGMFFTFRAGAYGANTGLRLTDDFYYETRRRNNHQRMDILYEDEATSFSRLQFAIRRKAQLNAMFVNSDSGGGSEEFDYDFIFGDLGSDEMSASLLTLTTGSYMNYWSPGGITRDAYFQGNLVFNASESLAQQLRTFLATDGVLTLGYADPTKPATIRTPDYYNPDDEDSTEDDPVATDEALGTGFRLSFRQPNPSNWGQAGVAHVNMPKRVLASVAEYDLTTPGGGSSAGWTCPQSLQFKVVHPDAAPVMFMGEATCPSVADDHVDNSDTATLALLRRTLPQPDWDVNIRKKCVVPRRYTMGSCYGIDSGQNVTRTAEQNLTAVCSPSTQNGTLVCSHFLSICRK